MFVRKHIALKALKCSNQIDFSLRNGFSSSIDHLVKPITVNFGKSLYPKLRLQNPKLYKYYRSGGLDVTVDYLDTKQDGKEYKKVIVATHGTPDTCRTFSILAQHYLDSDVRVVAPNLPNFTQTRKNKIFWHTSEEKAQFVREFLHKIGVDSIDCLLSHSFGVQEMSKLWMKSFDLNVKSVAMLAPQTMLDTDTRRYNLGKSFFISRSEWWYNLMSLLKFNKLPILPMEFKTIDEFLWLAAPGFDLEDAIKIVDRLIALKEMNIPTVVVFGSKEKIVSRRGIAQLRDVLSIPQEEVITVSTDNFKSEDLSLKHRRSLYILQDARHFIHSTHPQIINQIVDNLLRC